MSDSATLWTGAYQAPLSMGFPRQEYWNGLPFPSPGDLPNPEMEPRSPALEADALTSEPPGKPRNQRERLYFQCFSSFVRRFWFNFPSAAFNSKPLWSNLGVVEVT